MLKIAVTGPPGSNHGIVSKELSTRLDTEYFSAKQLAFAWCSGNNISYYLFKNHYQVDGDTFIDDSLTEWLKKNEMHHTVVDSFRANTVDLHIKVLLNNCILDDPMLSRALYEERLCECKLADNSELFSEKLYDMSFPSIYLTSKQVVDCIIQQIICGKFIYHCLHPYQVLPLHPTEVHPKVPYRPKTTVFNIVKYGHCYFLQDISQYNDYMWHLVHRKPLQVDIEETSFEFKDLISFYQYKGLLSTLPENVRNRLELCYRLARYAAFHEVTDHDLLYLDLSKNANPLRVLREGDF